MPLKEYMYSCVSRAAEVVTQILHTTRVRAHLANCHHLSGHHTADSSYRGDLALASIGR